MMRIIPAIIPKNLDDLAAKLSSVAGFAPVVQIDVLDGRLVPHTSWPYVTPQDEDFSRIIREEEGLPYWEELSFEIDMMVADPMTVAPQWVAAGAERLVFHAESFTSPQAAREAIERFKADYSLSGGALSVEAGLALNLDSDVLEHRDALAAADFFQCMGIAEIGVQGAVFDDRALRRVAEVREMFPDLRISVDGGVNEENAEALIRAGADRLVVGSAIFRSTHIPDTISTLSEIADAASH
jgi:ribulose-phosphate 3-epimerase